MSDLGISPELAIAADPRQRPSNLVRVEIQAFLLIPKDELAAHSRPGWQWQGVDVARLKLIESGSLNEFLDKIEQYAVDDAVTVRITS